jgi:plasmid stability protein
VNITLKDIPSRLHKQLKERAVRNNRSLNWEVIDILEKVVHTAPVNTAEFLKGGGGSAEWV